MTFFCYWLCTFAIILPKIGKIRAFYCDWLCKNAFALPKIGKTRTFFSDWLCKYTFDSPKIGKIHTFFCGWFFEMRDFRLNWLRKYALILLKLFFFWLTFWNAQFFAITRKYAIISPKILKFRTFFATSCRNWTFSNAWFVM